MNYSTTIRVVAAVIEQDGRYLITQRRPNAVLPLEPPDDEPSNVAGGMSHAESAALAPIRTQSKDARVTASWYAIAVCSKRHFRSGRAACSCSPRRRA